MGPLVARLIRGQTGDPGAAAPAVEPQSFT